MQVVTLMLWLLYPQEKNKQYPLERKTGMMTQSQSEFGGEKISLY
jgi:hypothetical protein